MLSRHLSPPEYGRWEHTGIHVSRLKAQIIIFSSPQPLGAFAPEHGAKLRNHAIAAAARERALRVCSASLLIQPAQLSIQL